MDGREADASTKNTQGGVRAGKDARAGEKRRKAERPSPRIRQAAQRIQAEAARALAEEPVPRKSDAAPARRALPLPDFAKGLDKNEREQLVEIMDADNRPLAVMTPENALRQRLRFRRVAVILRAASQVLLVRRKDERPDRPAPWGMGSGFVRVGEACEDTVLRLMAEIAGCDGIHPHLAAVAAKDAGFAYDLELYVADAPKGPLSWQEGFEGCAMDQDELEGVLKGAPELFSHELRWAVETGRLFER